MRMFWVKYRRYFIFHFSFSLETENISAIRHSFSLLDVIRLTVKSFSVKLEYITAEAQQCECARGEGARRRGELVLINKTQQWNCNIYRCKNFLIHWLFVDPICLIRPMILVINFRIRGFLGFRDNCLNIIRWKKGNQSEYTSPPQEHC